jgi:hypothetical protein
MPLQFARDENDLPATVSHFPDDIRLSAYEPTKPAKAQNSPAKRKPTKKKPTKG